MGQSSLIFGLLGRMSSFSQGGSVAFFLFRHTMEKMNTHKSLHSHSSVKPVIPRTKSSQKIWIVGCLAVVLLGCVGGLKWQKQALSVQNIAIQERINKKQAFLEALARKQSQESANGTPEQILQRAETFRTEWSWIVEAVWAAEQALGRQVSFGAFSPSAEGEISLSGIATSEEGIAKTIEILSDLEYVENPFVKAISGENPYEFQISFRVLRPKP